MLQQLAALVPDDRMEEEAQVFYLWPEHVPAYELFERLQSQWRIGMQGCTGLDYGGVIAWLRETVPKRTRRAELLDELQIMEYAALGYWAERRKEATDQPT